MLMPKQRRCGRMPERLENVVLVVDDDEALRHLVATWLSRSGLEPVEAETGQEALAIAAENGSQIDAMVCDVMMPGMNGYDVLEHLKKNPATATIPVLMLTAHATKEMDIVCSAESGAIDHLLKPFSGPVLVAKVRAACERSQHDRKVRGQLACAEANATIDALTQLFNRRHFDTRLALECAAAKRHARSYALLFIDLDNFKLVNDTFGHQAGDRVLSHVASVIKQLATALKQAVREEDMAFRYGGEEFAVLLTGCDERGAIIAGERLAAALRDKPIRVGSTDLVITFSGGVASADEKNGFSAEHVVERADAALYRAKNGGRNRVFGESTP